ncbi:MAG TPA: PEGA domain-containing protein [Candidatus Angelobacter sp.]
MKVQMSRALAISLLTLAGTNLSLPGNAQSDTPSEKPPDTGQIRVNVSPEEAYIWVDDKATSHRSSTLKLPTGPHKIMVYNYGYKPERHDINVVAGERSEITANLKPAGEPVSGPWGRIQIERIRGDALVFLNGTTPEFFVGHVDEMNNHIFGDQALIVPAGKQQVHVLENKTEKEIWAGTVEVKENQRLIIYATYPPDQQLIYKNWPEGAKLSHLRRFEAGTATATIAVAPVKSKLAVDHTDVQCNEPVKVSWDSTDAAHTIIKANETPLAYAVAGAVEQRPLQTTKYEFHAAGPGGIVNSEATVNVDNTVKASLSPTTSEQRYVKVGDKVQEQGTTELKWTATNADSVKIDPLGVVTGAGGSPTIQISPEKDSPGPVDETHTYKITATNICGGSATSVATVHLTGSIEPEPQVVAAAEPTTELPNTASPLPLLGLTGLLFLGTGSLLKRKRMK